MNNSEKEIREKYLHRPLQSIHQILQEGELNVFILADNAMERRLRPQVYNLLDIPKNKLLFFQTPYIENFRDRSPFLNQVFLNDYAFLNFALETTPDHIMIIFSTYSIEKLFQHWRSLLHVRDTDGSIHLHLFFRPTTLKRWLNATQPDEQAALLAYSDALYMLNEKDQWQCYYKINPEIKPLLPEYTECHRFDPLDKPWWQIQQRHLEHIMSEDHYIDNMIQHLYRHHRESVEHYDDALPEMIEWALIKARVYHLDSQKELFLFVSLMFSIAPDFDQHPKIQKWFITRSKDDQFIHIVTDVPDHIWDEIQQNRDESVWLSPLNEPLMA